MGLIDKLRCFCAYRGHGVNRGENYAVYYLKKHGYKVIEQNYDIHWAEIDIIAVKGDLLSFVEVKQRKGTRFGTPGEAVNREKQSKIKRAAQMYLMKNKLKCRVSFDVIEIYGECSDERLPRLVHIPSAFM